MRMKVKWWSLQYKPEANRTRVPVLEVGFWKQNRSKPHPPQNRPGTLSEIKALYFLITGIPQHSQQQGPYRNSGISLLEKKSPEVTHCCWSNLIACCCQKERSTHNIYATVPWHIKDGSHRQALCKGFGPRWSLLWADLTHCLGNPLTGFICWRFCSTYWAESARGRVWYHQSRREGGREGKSTTCLSSSSVRSALPPHVIPSKEQLFWKPA